MSAITQPMLPFCSYENLCEITQAFKISILQPKPHFVAAKTPAKHPFGTRVPFHGCEITKAFKNSISQPKTHFATAKPLAKHPFGTKCHFAAAKWAAKTALGCENEPPLRKCPSFAKSPTVTWIQFKRFKFQIFILNRSFALRKLPFCAK